MLPRRWRKKKIDRQTVGIVVETPSVIKRKMFLTSFVFGLIIAKPGTANAKETSNITDMILKLQSLLQQGGSYNKAIRPFTDSGAPVKVYVDLFVEAVGTMSEIKMDFPVTLYLRQEWKDPRMAFEDSFETLQLREVGDLLWTPDTYFLAAKDEIRHNVPTPNILIKFHPDGTIFRSERISLRLLCQLRLQKFPLDEQECQVDMESYAYTTEDIVYTWHSSRGPVVLSKDIDIPHFILKNIAVEENNRSLATGYFSSLNAKIHMKREIGHYLIQTYIPSVLIVILSWVSFWIDHHAIPARISLGLLTVLTMTTQSSNSQTQLPKVSYVKGIDVWMSACLVFVFGALIEFAVVNVYTRKYKRTQRGKGDQEGIFMMYNLTKDFSINPSFKPHLDSEADSSQNQKGNRNRGKTAKRQENSDRGRKLDKASRLVFPLSFIVFNICYWIYYR